MTASSELSITWADIGRALEANARRGEAHYDDPIYLPARLYHDAETQGYDMRGFAIMPMIPVPPSVPGGAVFSKVYHASAAPRWNACPGAQKQHMTPEPPAVIAPKPCPWEAECQRGRECFCAAMGQ